jgi:hypothetical protein
MLKYLFVGAVVATAVATSPVAAPPAFAQASGEIIVYGTDPCPRATDDEIVVCRRLPEAMRYRIPEKMRPDGTIQEKQSWAVKSKQMLTVGDTGIGSCSAVGPGGHTGCLTREIMNARKATTESSEADRAPEQ